MIYKIFDSLILMLMKTITDVTIPEPTTPKPTPLRPTTFKGYDLLYHYLIHYVLFLESSLPQ